MSSVELSSVVPALTPHVQALVALGFIIAAPVPAGIAFAVAHTGSRLAPLSHYVVIVGMSWLTAQTVLALLLGLLSRLTLVHVIVAELVLCGLGVVALVRCPSTPSVRGAGVRLPAGVGTPIVVFLSSVAAWLLHHTLTTPIHEYDSLAYHLPAVAHWYRTAGLEMLGQGLVDHYPYNFELIALLFVLPFHGHFAVGLVQVLAWSLFGTAVYAIATLLGARPLPGLIAALLAMLQPLVLGLVTDTLQVDLAFAAAFLITVYLALGYAMRNLHWSLVVLSGAWLAGTKASGAVYLCLIVLVVWVARRSIPPRAPGSTRFEPGRLPTAVVLASLLAALMSGGFWYARNVLATGNPLGRVGLTLVGIPILDGPIASSELSRSSLAVVFRVFELGDWMIFLKQVVVRLGLPFAFLLIAGGLLVGARTNGKPFWRDRVALFVVALFVACTALYVFTPFSGDDVGTHGWRVTPWIGQGLRYALPAAGILAVAAALGMTRLDRFDTVLAALAAVVGLLSLPRGRVPVLFTFVVVWLWVSLRRRLPRWGRRGVTYGSVVVVIVASLVFRDLKDAAHAEMFPVVAYIDRYVAHGERIGLLVTNRAYLFFGSRLTADVAFVPHGEADASQWVRRLQERSIRFIGIGPVLEDWWLSSNEVAWLENDRRFFERVYGADYRRGSVLYRVRGMDDSPGAPHRAGGSDP